MAAKIKSLTIADAIKKADIEGIVVKISNKLRISIDESYLIGKQLIELGSLIEISENEFEAMHPRFTAVNMYRKMCEREKVEFKRNVTVDNIGVVLERPYDDARTK